MNLGWGMASNQRDWRDEEDMKVVIDISNADTQVIRVGERHDDEYEDMILSQPANQQDWSDSGSEAEGSFSQRDESSTVYPIGVNWNSNRNSEYMTGRF